MTRPIFLYLLILATLTLTSCGDGTAPSRSPNGDELPTATSLAAASNTWTAKAPMPTRGRGWWVINRKFYVAGGRGGNNQDSNKLDVYDPVTNTWRTLASMPTARAGVAAAVVAGKLYVLGEANVKPGEGQNTVEAYHAATNT
jgi:hypothetical protein